MLQHCTHVQWGFSILLHVHSTISQRHGEITTINFVLLKLHLHLIGNQIFIIIPAEPDGQKIIK